MPSEFRGSIINRTSRLDARFVDMKFIEDKFRSREEKLKSDVSSLITRQIKLETSRHRVVKALRNPSVGVGGEDLPALFGLDRGDAEEAASQISEILGDSVDVVVETGTIKKTRGLPSLSFKITPKFLNAADYEDDFDEAPFIYQSKRSVIPWMRWVLNPNEADALINADLTNIKNYGIVYDLPSDILGRYSRSGRALMLRRNKKNENRRRMFTFRLPAIARPTAGSNNFVEEIANNKLFRSRLDGFIRNAVSKILGAGV